MSTTKTKKELVRLAWITELRRQGDRQCFEADSRGHKVCALMLLAEVAGLANHRSFPGYRPIEESAGLSPDQGSDVVRMNDGFGHYHKHTFAEIADVVAGWFQS